MSRSLVTLALLLLPHFAADARGQAAPRFVLSSDTALIDEPIDIRLVGLPADRDITVRLAGLGNASGWHASARFRSDAAGSVDLTRTAPVDGDYNGAHAMGLFWSARPDSGAHPLIISAVRSPDVIVPPAQSWELRADVDGRLLAADTVWRLAISPSVSIVPVRENGIVGTLYVPPGGGGHPAVIVLNGSQGGIAPPSGTPGGLASRGYVVLALGYFAAQDLPERLVDIPLESFGTAIRWLAAQPSVDSTRIAVLGQSRGGELALLLGSIFPTIRTVVAYVPSHVVWPGTITDNVRAPAWTLGGKPVPGMFNRASERAVAHYAGCPSAPTCREPLTVHHFLALLDDRATVARAEIPVERINGPVLLISGRSDGLWPSTLMADRVIARLHGHNFAHAAEHFAYADAGHAIGRPYFPTPDVGRARPHPITHRMVVPGGTPAGTALASEDSWRRVLAFLEKSLRDRQ